VPQKVFLVQPRVALNEQPDYSGVARPCCLVQRRRVRVAAHRVIPVRVFAGIQQQSNNLDVTELRSQRECKVTLIGGRVWK
jgi:hypothetical protein